MKTIHFVALGVLAGVAILIALPSKAETPSLPKPPPPPPPEPQPPRPPPSPPPQPPIPPRARPFIDLPVGTLVIVKPGTPDATGPFRGSAYQFVIDTKAIGGGYDGATVYSGHHRYYLEPGKTFTDNDVVGVIP